MMVYPTSMTREKPKDMAGRRRAHLALQARRDALARMRAGETVTVKLVGGVTVRARAAGDEEHLDQVEILVLMNRRLRVATCVYKDGLRAMTWYNGSRHIGDKDILGVVVERVSGP